MLNERWNGWWGRGRRAAAVALGVALLGLVGCDSDDDFDHTPPAGQGTLVVDNNTPGDINVYVDGTLQAKANDDSEAFVDAAPGQHRVVLDGEDDDRLFSADVDILDGRLTILRVSVDFGHSDRYDVRSELD